MTVTPIFDDLTAHYAAGGPPSVRVAADPARRPSPRPRPGAVVGSDAFGRGCLEAEPTERVTGDDEVARLLDGARREAVALGRRWVDTGHLAVAAVRAGGDVARVFGMRGAGPAVLLAALDDGGPEAPDDLAGGDPARPAVSSVARTVLYRVAHRAAREGRAVTAAELAVAVARSGRVADLLGRLGVDLDDLADALAVVDPPAGGSTTATPVDLRPRRVPVPVGVVAPVTVMLPAAAPVVGDDRAAVVPA